MGSIIRVNNVEYRGNSISISNGKVIIDGVEVKGTKDEKKINIVVEGNLESLDVDCCDKVEINGSADQVKTLSGNVHVKGDVTDSIKTMSGNVHVSGAVGGKVKTMSGNISHN
jgi:hypothetical protein